MLYLYYDKFYIPGINRMQINEWMSWTFTTTKEFLEFEMEFKTEITVQDACRWQNKIT
jgi:hypothetical protein